MGCGGPRAAEETASMNIKTLIGRLLGKPVEPPPPEPITPEEREAHQSMLDFLVPSLTGRALMTDIDRRSALEIALRDADPSFLGIVAVDDDDGSVVFQAFSPEGGVRMYSRPYSQRAGKVKLGDGSKEVRGETKFVPASALRAACACEDALQGGVGAKGDGDMKTKDERVTALIASKKNAFSDIHKAFLSELPEEQLAAFETHEATEPASTPKPEEPTAVPIVAAETEEQQLAKLPKTLQVLVANAKAVDASRRTQLLAVLKGSQNAAVFTDEQLNSKPTEDLEQLARFAGAEIDYSLAAPAKRAASDDFTAPDPWAKAYPKQASA
jgi:hypothetical protein